MRLAFTLAVLLIGYTSFSQLPVFSGDPVSPRTKEALTAQFKEYAVYRIDVSALNQYAKEEAGKRSFRLQLEGKHDWELHIEGRDIRAAGYKVRLATEDGVVVMPPTENKTFRGQRGGDPSQVVSLTLDHEFIYGYVEEGEETWFIEPLWYFIPDADRDLFLVYPASKVIPVEGKTCGVDELRHRKGEHPAHKPGDMPETGNCYRLELAIASDWLMVQAYGSQAGVENHNIGVMNNVQNNWDDEFSDEINFFIVEQFISTCSTCDPWTSSTNAEILLDDFTDWGPTGFSATHDLGQIWTDREFDGPTIGIAWLGAVCTNFRYHALSDFSSNANLKRVMTAHEIGHNFDAIHDPANSPYIMAPAVQNTSIWSTLTETDVNAFILQVDPPNGCLTVCPPPLPPTPAFSANITLLCPGSFVTFFDESTNQPTSWSWSMPGASPSSSTQRSPTVVYNNPGTYNVTLTVSNSNGSNSLTKTAYIVVTPSGGTDFFFFEGFENGTGSWLIQNPDNGITWANTTVNGTRQGSKAMMLDNFNYPVSGQRDGLISPVFSLFGRDNAVLEVEYAYARYNSTRRDSLIVYISTNGGGTYTRLFAATENGNGNFATKSDMTTPFNPQSQSEWCFGAGGPNCLSLNLAAYAGFSNCRIKIENFTGRGNRMYIDNVRIMSNCENPVPPTANFAASPTNGCAALQVNFQDLSTNSPMSWNWSFPGAIPPSSTLQNPVVLYPVPGVYTVTLTVTNPAGSNTLTKTDYITVGGPPAASFTHVVNGYTATFTNTSSSNATAFTWDFGDGTTSTLQNPPPHVYQEDGAYIVTLTASNACGSNSFQQTVLILNPPTAGFSANPTSGCEPLTVQFTNESSSNAVSFNWSFPGGDPATSTEEDPVVIYETPGIYDVTLIVENAYGIDTLVQTDLIVVDPAPSAGFTFSVSGDTATFTNTSTNAVSYLWDFGDGNSSTASDPVHVYAQNGLYDVTLTAYGACDTVTATQTVEIALVPLAGFAADATEGCTPFTVQFSDLSENNPSSWAWIFEGGDPATSTIQNPEVTYLQAGVFDVTLIVTNSAGSDTIAFQNYISVAVGPTAGFTTSVSGTEATFTNTSVNALSYFWDFGDGNSSTETDPVHDFGTDGVYTVLLIASNDCGPDTFSMEVEIVTPPLAGFSASSVEGCAPLLVQFTDESTENATAWSWTFEGGTPSSSTERDPEVEYLSPGVYSVTLTVSNVAGSDTVTEEGYITVEGLPSAGFTFTANGTTIEFNNSSAGATTYHWDFGDGNTSTESDPVHTYAIGGAYQVELIAIGDCGADTTIVEVDVLLAPVAGFTADITEGCAPMTVQFTNTSSASATSWSWTFEGGTPAASTEENPVVEYLSPGSYGVTLTVGNAVGEDTESYEDYITVNEGPAAGFTANVNGTEAAFSNASSNAVTYEWDFGDGNSSTESDPIHSYDQDGTYWVILIATGDCGADTTTQEVVILTPPIAGFTADETEGCMPLTVQFEDQSSPNTTSWSWEFEGGAPATSTDQHPLVEYLETGVFGVTLTVSNGAGSDEVSVSSYITVLPDPEAGFDAAVNGNQATFTNTSSNGVTYLWDFGDGTGSTQQNPQHSYSQDGVYTVTLTVINDCGTDVFTKQVAIATAGPLALFEASPGAGCATLLVAFENLSSGNSESFEWQFPGGEPATSTESEPVVTYEQPGVYDVVLIASNPNGSDTLTLNAVVEVLPFPVAGFTYMILNGASVLFDNTSAHAISYSWDFGDGSSSAAAEPVHTYNQTGTFTVVLTVEGECGTDTYTQQVTINEVIPTATFTGAPISGCAPLTVQFEDQTTGNPSQWNWTFPGGDPSSSTEQHPVVVYETEGQFTVTLQVTNAAGSDVLMQSEYVKVSDVPQANFTFDIQGDGTTVTFNNGTTGADSFHWDFGDGETSMLNSPSHAYDEPGSYTVVLTATNECGDHTFTEQIVISSAFDLGMDGQWLVWPNPNTGQFTIRIQAAELSNETVGIRLVNALGQVLLVQEVQLPPGGLIHAIDRRDLASGFYWLEVRVGDQRTGTKLVIE